MQGVSSVTSNKLVKSQIKSKHNKPPGDLFIKPVKIMSNKGKYISFKPSLVESRNVTKSNTSKPKTAIILATVNNIETINAISVDEPMTKTNKSHAERSCSKISVSVAQTVICSSRTEKMTGDTFRQKLNTRTLIKQI